MPCICYGAMSGEDAYDHFLKSDAGQTAMNNLKMAAILIKKYDLPLEAIHRTNDIEFRHIFVKAFMHMLIGCDEKGNPTANRD